MGRGGGTVRSYSKQSMAGQRTGRLVGSGLRCINLVHHEIHDHARDAYIEPQRQRPSRNQLVLVEFLQPSAAQRHQNHRYDDNGQNRVRNQNREVDGSNPTLSVKHHMSHAIVINQIGSQKCRRNPKRGNHEEFVYRHLPTANSDIARDQQDRACAIQNRIERCLRNQ